MNTDLIRPIGDLSRMQGQIHPDKLAFVSEARRVTFGEVDRLSDHIASGLLGHGIEKGDRVATYMTNSVELVLAYTGIAKSGAITVFVNEQLTPREIRYILKDSGAKMIVTDEAHLAHVLEVCPDCPELLTMVVAGAERDGLVSFRELEKAVLVPLPVLAPDDSAWIGYTSGTTGDPKGALLTHRNVTWVSASCLDAYQFGATDRMLCTLPLFHSYAVNMCYVQVLASGCTEYLLPRFSPQKTLEWLERYEITVLPQVPTGYNYLANVGPSGRSVASLRLAISAGAVLPAKVLADFEAAFDVTIHDGWGSTETSMDAISMRVGSSVVPGSCGLAFPGCSARVVNEHDEDVPTGEWGELVIRGPNVMQEYINKPELTARALKGGWYHTGDMAYQDANGYLFIVDRLKDVIISGGYNIAPKEIEDVLASHPAVLETAVVGVPHESRGEIVRAYVVPKPDAALTGEMILQHCQPLLAAYKQPREVVVTDRIPRTSSGKVMRYKLRDGRTD